MYKLYNDDCLNVFPNILTNSIDAIISDWPYGITANKWDSVIPLDILWSECVRVLKPNGTIILTADEPFTSVLIFNDLKMFKYKWIWDKQRATGHLNAKHRPMKVTEDVLIFYDKLGTYNPQLIKGTPYKVTNGGTSTNYGKQCPGIVTNNSGWRYPQNIISIKQEGNKHKYHPTQKPVALMEYLINTYTNPNDVILDNAMGSGTTGVAAIGLNRKFIGIELDVEYYKIADVRIKNVNPNFMLE